MLDIISCGDGHKNAKIDEGVIIRGAFPQLPPQGKRTSKSWEEKCCFSKSKSSPDGTRTHSFLIRSQTRYHCATGDVTPTSDIYYLYTVTIFWPNRLIQLRCTKSSLLYWTEYMQHIKWTYLMDWSHNAKLLLVSSSSHHNCTLCTCWHCPSSRQGFIMCFRYLMALLHCTELTRHHGLTLSLPRVLHCVNALPPFLMTSHMMDRALLISWILLHQHKYVWQGFQRNVIKVLDALHPSVSIRKNAIQLMPSILLWITLNQFWCGCNQQLRSDQKDQSPRVKILFLLSQLCPPCRREKLPSSLCVIVKLSRLLLHRHCWDRCRQDPDVLHKQVNQQCISWCSHIVATEIETIEPFA